MTPPPDHPDGVLVVGDAQQRLTFIDAGAGVVTGSAELQYGQLTSPPTLWGTLALLGEGAARQGASALHAFDLSAAAITDIWNPGIQVTGSIDASPVVLGDTMWAASDAGYLFGVGISNIGAPRPRPPVNVLRLPAGTTAKVTGLLAASDGQHLLLVTQRGAYGIDLTGPTPTVAWQALTSIDLTGVAAVLDEDLLLVASGDKVYALAAYPTSSTPEPVWTYQADYPITRMLALGQRFVLLITDHTWAYLIDNSNATSRARFAMPLDTGAAAWTGLCADTLVSLSPAGGIQAYRLPVSPTGTVEPEQLWTDSPGPRFAGPPATTCGLAFAVGVDGSLRVLNVTNQTIVYTLSAVSGTLSGAVLFFAPAVRGASTASVRFLLDGENFMPTMRDLLIAVTQKSFAPPPALPASLKFDDMIKQIGKSGSNAYVLMWDTSPIYAMTEDAKSWTTKQFATTLGATYLKAFTPFGAVRGDHRLNAQTYLSLYGAENVAVYLEPYATTLNVWFERPVELGSNHEKIAIFSVRGTKLALVSGFNVASYYDQITHPMQQPDGSYQAFSWHDTGVLLQGPIVAQVEAEFDRRWNKMTFKYPAPNSDTYVKVASWQIARDTCLDAPGVCADPPTRQPVPYTDRRPTTPPVPMRLALTCNEQFVATSRQNFSALLSGVFQVRQQLVGAIGAATRYVYLENYALQDVATVQALANRIKAAQSGFVVIVAVPHPTVSDAEGYFNWNQGNFTLTRFACGALTLSSQDWTTAVTESGQRFQAADGATVIFHPSGIEYTRVRFGRSSPVTVDIRAVTEIVLADKQRTVQFCSPARYIDPEPPDHEAELVGRPVNFRAVYVHSKLALIDDLTLVVGSTNFTQRSMLQDGEMSVFIADATTATGARQQIFNHWKMTTPSDWQTDAARFAAATTPSLGILPLPFESMPRYPANFPWLFMTLVFDPSQLF
jgi:phosphatidylserine/phosphatidylglycerophosphate/cardiolipin synthase-like enzyme